MQLRLAASRRLGGDDYWDDWRTQIATCTACRRNAICEYNEERRGADERFEHFGYLLSNEVQAERDGRIEGMGVEAVLATVVYGALPSVKLSGCGETSITMAQNQLSLGPPLRNVFP